MTSNCVGLIFTKSDGCRTFWQISIMVDYVYSRIGIMMFEMFELVAGELANVSRQLQGLRGLARLIQASPIYRHS